MLTVKVRVDVSPEAMDTGEKAFSKVGGDAGVVVPGVNVISEVPNPKFKSAVNVGSIPPAGSRKLSPLES